VDLTRLKRQDGLVREAVKYFALFVVILVMILDAIAVLQVQLSVRDNAKVAAGEALSQYANGASRGQAEDAAQSYVEAKGGRYLSAHWSGGPARDDTVVTVTAERDSSTYLYRYFTYLPWGLGERVDNLLNPTATADNQ
jgi:hypothetical protein